MAEAQESTPGRLDALLVYIQAAALPFVFSRRTQLGLYFLAQHAADTGFAVRVDNLSSNDLCVTRLHRILRETSCPLLGLYVDQDNLWPVRHVVARLKTLLPSLNVILGGPQMTADPEITLQRIPQAACGCIGEGEEVFVELLSLPTFSESELLKCKGLAIRDGTRTLFTGSRAPITPLDKLSFPRRRELTIDHPRTLEPTMITGRGCSGRCAFCYEGGQWEAGKRLRLHSLERTLQEFDYLVQESGNCYITIMDDAFVTSADRLTKFCTELIKRYGGKIKWFCESRVDVLARNAELLPLMIEAGLIRVQVGGESGDQHILDAYRKGTTVEQLVQVVESAMKYGLVSLFANFIVGGALETRATFEKTRDLALDLLRRGPGCVAIDCSIYTPYPGTPMFANPAAFGITTVDPEVVTGMGDHHAYCSTAALSRFEVLALKSEFERSVRETILALCRSLPAEIVERQFRLFYEWRLATEWYEVLAENQPLALYYRSLYSGRAKPYEEAAAAGFRDFCPTRLADPVTTRGCNYLLRTPGGTIRELDDLESRIYDLSAGKLTFDEVIEVLAGWLPACEPAALRQAVAERYGSFGSDRLIVWRPAAA